MLSQKLLCLTVSGRTLLFFSFCCQRFFFGGGAMSEKLKQRNFPPQKIGSVFFPKSREAFLHQSNSSHETVLWFKRICKINHANRPDQTNKTKQNKPKQNKPKQNQNKTNQNKTKPKQNKTKQNQTNEQTNKQTNKTAKRIAVSTPIVLRSFRKPVHAQWVQHNLGEG